MAQKSLTATKNRFFMIGIFAWALLVFRVGLVIWAWLCARLLEKSCSYEQCSSSSW